MNELAELVAERQEPLEDLAASELALAWYAEALLEYLEEQEAAEERARSGSGASWSAS